MKFIKHLIIYEAVCIVFVLFLCFEFSFVLSGVVDAGNEISGNSQQKVYMPQIKADVYLNQQQLLINEEIKLNAPSKEIWLNIPSGLYSSVNIKSIFPENNHIEMLNGNVAMHLSFPNSTDLISLQFEMHIEQRRGLLSYNSDKILLTEFLITPAPYIKDKFVLCERSTVGDPFVYPCCDYNVKLDTDAVYTAFAPGETSETSENSRKSFTFQAKGVRDFPIALVKNPVITKQKIRDINITYVGMPDVHNDVVKVFDYMESRTCKYPYKELFVLNAPIETQGMEFSQMVFISDQLISNKLILNKVVQHEVFHQWFYGIVGTDQVNEPFMDEGMVSFLVKDLNGEKVDAKYNDKLIQLNLTQYNSEKDYYNMVYNGGQSMFSYLHEKYGVVFDKCMQTIFEKYNGKILTYEDFRNQLEDTKTEMMK